MPSAVGWYGIVQTTITYPILRMMMPKLVKWFCASTNEDGTKGESRRFPT